MTELPRESGLGWPGDLPEASAPMPSAAPAPRQSRPDFSLQNLLAEGMTHEHEDAVIGAVRLVVSERNLEQRRATELKAENNTLRQLAYTDELTGLPNRRAIMRTVDTLVSSEAGRFGLIFIDLDDLKKANEKSYDEGDMLLVRTAQSIIGDTLRTGDDEEHAKRRHDVAGSDVGRLGGDEFVVVLRDIEDQAQLSVVNHRIITRLEEAGIRASTGAAKHEPGMSRQELVELANQAESIDKLERRAELQAEELNSLPAEERAADDAVTRAFEEHGINLVDYWRRHGPTSR